MDLIDKLSKYAQEDGLPVGLLQVDKCLMNGSTGAREDIRQGAKTKKREPLWNDICTTLWGGGSEGTTAPGLLSGLGSAVSETKAKVVAALKLCDGKLDRGQTDNTRDKLNANLMSHDRQWPGLLWTALGGNALGRRRRFSPRLPTKSAPPGRWSMQPRLRWRMLSPGRRRPSTR